MFLLRDHVLSALTMSFLVLAATGCNVDVAGSDDVDDGVEKSDPEEEGSAATHVDGDADGDSDIDGDSDDDTPIVVDNPAPDGDADTDVDGDSDNDIQPAPIEEIVAPEEPSVPPEERTPPEDSGCDTETDVVLYLSADDSNSMAGPVIARQTIQDGMPFMHEVRVYEFLNYYGFNYEAAEPGTVSVSAQLQPTGDDDESFNLQIGVRAPDQDDAERRPLNITLSLDTSGSMEGHPIEMIRKSCLALASSLREGDIVSMVTWSTTQNIILESHQITGSEDAVLVTSCQDLRADGGTDLNAGLQEAYRLARENQSEARINRVLLMSDGGANVGTTSASLIAANADDAEGEAIYLLGAGMGTPGYYEDDLMNIVTDAGKGAYIYIDNVEEAWRMFGSRFLANVEVAARDVQIELTLPPTFGMTEFHGEEYSSNSASVDPQHLAPNDAMIFHQIISSCDIDWVDLDAPVQVVATFETPLTRQLRSASYETTFGALLEGETDKLIKGNAIVAYALALDEVRQYTSYSASAYEREMAETILQEARDIVDSALVELGDDPDLIELNGLLGLYITQFRKY